ncbi:GLPGLI family protein [Fibrella sp. HMF5335]|uniref:GLPGLI family protein n=2 Tax=Fibrella rubiginis TaxID=2817060 RepID=A0A939GH95_9BACT|nr:GLPGLI family protein [Fibrella rubiginis]
MRLFAQHILLSCLLTLSALAQTPPAATTAVPPAANAAPITEGVVHYERRAFWPKIYARMTYLSQEQKDRIANLTRNFTQQKIKMNLTFSGTQSLYTHGSESAEYEDFDFKGRNEELVFYRDFDKERLLDIEETLGKTYIVSDSLRLPSWKIGNQIREIAGHLCMKATTSDPIRSQSITAWFAQDIPVPAGPEKYCGLPGLILELDINDGDVIIEAMSIDAKPVADVLKPPKVKAKTKRTTQAEFDKLLKNHIAEQMKEQQNPYWSIRY